MQLEVVGLDVPSTDTTWNSRSCGIQYQNLRPINMDFSQGLRDDSKEFSIDATPVGWAALWMRIDGEDGEILGFDNMQRNPINGTTDWNYFECVLDVPSMAKAVAFGVLLSGEGRVWFSKVALEPALDDVEVTDTKADIQARHEPVNMCFEEG